MRVETGLGPVLFHNLEGYDSHLFVKSLGLTRGILIVFQKQMRNTLVLVRISQWSHTQLCYTTETLRRKQFVWR